MSDTADWADKSAADALVNILWMSEEEQSKGLRDVAHALRAAKQACPLHDSAELLQFVRDMRGIEGETCTACDGWGVRAYASTATWHGGIGGAMITSAVCDKCWGSGDLNRPWLNLRTLPRPAQVGDKK